MESTPTRPVGKPKNLVLAYILWFFFGNFGLHRFYLGRRESGIGYLILSGILAGVAALIGTVPLALAVSYQGPVPLVIFAAFIRLFWLYDLFYLPMMARSLVDPDYKAPLEDLWQPFIDLARAPRALWGVNLAYCLEGWVYFGMLGYLAIHFSDFVFKGVANPDVQSHHMVGILTAGITLSMFFFGSVADRKGVRKTLIMAFVLLLAGRIIWSSAAYVFPEPGLRSGMHITTTIGIILVVLGYGLYQPAAYAGVRQFSSPKTAAMNYAMLYALMNLGGWLPSFFTPIREHYGITGAFWVYTGITLVALLATLVILTPGVAKRAIERAQRERAEAAETKEAAARETTGEADAAPAPAPAPLEEDRRIPVHLWIALPFIGWVVVAFLRSLVGVVLPSPWDWSLSLGALGIVAVVVLTRRAFTRKAYVWLANHPLTDGKFFFFIFILFFVQTLFTYNWLVLPQYLERAFSGTVVGDNYEAFANFNPLLIFFGVPMVAALTQKAKVYKMMVLGTAVMAAPAFLLSLGTSLPLLLGYLVLMTLGEAMWQPRFLQYAAEIAPEGRTGAYMGVAQFPWYMTKMLVPLYSGDLMQKFVPAEGPQHPETLWLISAIIAMLTPLGLFLAKNWVGKDFKTQA